MVNQNRFLVNPPFGGIAMKKYLQTLYLKVHKLGGFFEVCKKDMEEFTPYGLWARIAEEVFDDIDRVFVRKQQPFNETILCK